MRSVHTDRKRFQLAAEARQTALIACSREFEAQVKPLSFGKLSPSTYPRDK